MPHYWVYVGTSTGEKSRGIYRFQWDSSTGAPVSPVELAAETPNPTFLNLHPSGRFLYSVNAISDFNGERTGAVSAFAVDAATGGLTLLNQQPSGGTGPCHVVVSPDGGAVLTANYGGGSTASLPIEADGRLGPPVSAIQHVGSSVNPRRQEGPHAHSVNLDPSARFALTADLGLDQVLIYRFDAAAHTLTPHDPPFGRTAGGAGPRHLAFHPSGRFAYVINELDSTVTAFQWESGAGTLAVIQTISTLPKGFAGENYPAEIVAHRDGRFLYGSNRGHDSLAIFAVDGATGLLTPTGHAASGGKWPRNFNFDPTGDWVLIGNGSSDNIRICRVNRQDGSLTQVGADLEVPSPICHRFLQVSS